MLVFSAKSFFARIFPFLLDTSYLFLQICGTIGKQKH